MRSKRTRAALVRAVGQVLPILAIAPAGAQAPPDAVVKPLFSDVPADLAGKRMTVVEVEYPPGGSTPSHHHPGSVFAYVLSGKVRSQLDIESEPKIYGAGQSWYEPPGAHHAVSGNASTTEPARFIAVLIGPPEAPPVTPDPK